MTEWHGYVTDVDGDMFTAELQREGSHRRYLADFNMSQCGLSGVRPGDVIVVTPESVRLLDLGTWTKEELDEIRVRARIRSRQLRQNIDGGGDEI